MSIFLWHKDIEARLQSRLADAFAQAHLIHIPDIPAAAEAWMVWELARWSHATVLWIADGPRSLEWMARDLQSLTPPDTAPPLVFPSWEVLPTNTATMPDLGIMGARLDTLTSLAPGEPRVIATCAQALMERTLSREAFMAHTRILKTGDEVDPTELTTHLEQSGYSFSAEVQFQGDAALRGGILDIWPLTSPWPIRIEFFGSTVESLRTFDPAEQRSLAPVTEALLPPASEWKLLRSKAENRAFLFDHLRARPGSLLTNTPSLQDGSAGTPRPTDIIVIWADKDSILAHTATYEEAVREAKASAFVERLAAMEAALLARSALRQVFMGSRPDEPCPLLALDFQPVEPIPSITGRHVLHPDAIETSRRKFLTATAASLVNGTQTAFFFDSEGTHTRFEDVYGAIFKEAKPDIIMAPLTGGFASTEFNLMVVAEPDLYGRKIQRKRLPSRKTQAGGGTRITDWTDMEPGNLVVHIDHGVGRYLGLHEITMGNQLQEALAIEYAEGAKLYVPVSHAHLLTRYVGVGKHTTPLHQLGGKRWIHEKLAAQHAVQDMASSLLEIQAARDSQEGFAFPPDNPWQHELEASFPYQETDDQESAIREAKKDMESKRPMDRLLCGDAGYGKTEVAIRLAFKAVMSGKQVAVLVPTTILAQQHFQTFSERMAPFPIRIEMLSRFCTRGECTRVIQGLAEGKVDIVIGTHALIQPTIVFKDLGLVVIDEEQKFGVLHKERFKHIRRLVDVLTLTATPIPRTLYMSMTGARDLSTIQTPPQERLAVETIVTPDSDAVIREAILRELNREGQVFFLHNRVHSIERLRERIQHLVPEARIGVGHGQMAAGALEEVMRDFAQGEFDVLLCTTIIESGLDIPNANTILIDRADRFGLAELYQLRGRVGRSKHKAYAYMLLPTQAHVDPTARKRIQAIKQYSGAGTGFRLAMRDLEIRGAGNLLGASQSGHIAAVGFGLYCQLLRHTIAQKKGEPLPPVIDVDIILDFLSLSPSDTGANHSAIIPATYIEDERLRVGMYRRIAETGFVKEVRALRNSFRDRFGPIPAECERLLKLAEIRILAAGKKIKSIEVEDAKIMLKRHNDYLMLPGGRFPRLKSTSPDDRLDEIRSYIRKLE
ncbi:MAG: transcription-repair coupling factor [bacterium]|jgi:transcription-repair coupling factor (superfamily II helicase)